MQKSDAISSIVRGIYNDLNGNFQETFPSLMTGYAGCVLFNAFSISKNMGVGKVSFFESTMSSLANEAINFSYPSFCNGRSGLTWLFRYLQSIEVVEIDDNTLFEESEKELAQQALELLDKGNYDFLHGAIGIAYSLLFSPNKHNQFFSAFWIRLKKLLVKHTNGQLYIPSYDFQNFTLDIQKVNLGLAHGIPSILKFGLECRRKDICYQQATEMCEILTEFIINSRNVSANYCFYGNEVEISSIGIQSTNSRLAWCYGDLSIAFTLMQFATDFSNNEVMSYSKKVLSHTLPRQSFEDTFIYDPGLCHGSSGVAHIYNKIYHLSGDIDYKVAADYWFDKTMLFSIHNDGIGGFKKYDPIESKYKIDPYLLQGSSGIGLSLMSYLTNDFSWDYCLMLNI